MESNPPVTKSGVSQTCSTTELPNQMRVSFFDQCVYQFRHRELPPLWDLNPHTLTDSGFACFLAVRNPFCRDTRIRTWDPLLPKQMRYRAALHPEIMGGIRGLLPAGTSSLNFFRADRDAIDNRMHKWSNLQF